MLGSGGESDLLMLELRDSTGRKMSQCSDVFLGLDFRKAEYTRRKENRQVEESLRACISKREGPFLHGFLGFINKYLSSVQLITSEDIYKQLHDGVPLVGRS